MVDENRNSYYLHDCVYKSLESELFIVYSADICNALRIERDRFSQAILLIGEDIADIEGASLDTVLDNESLQGLVASLGVGIDISSYDISSSMLSCDLSKLRYGRLTVVTDGSAQGLRFEKAVFGALSKFYDRIDEVALITSAEYTFYEKDL